MIMDVGILAGGKGSRIGKNKAFLRHNGRTFLEIVVNELAPLGNVMLSVDIASTFKDVFQVRRSTGGSSTESVDVIDRNVDVFDGSVDAFVGSVDAFGHDAAISVLVVEDQTKEFGPVEGIRQLLQRSSTEYTFICAVDMPLIKKELALYMAEFISSDYDCYIVKDKSGVHPLCGIYSKKALPYFESALTEDARRLQTVLDRMMTKYISLEHSCFSGNTIRNINTPKDFSELVKPMIFCVCGVKNSGKTTLIESAIRELIQSYPKIAVIKHDGHDFEMDTPGKDTYRYSQAGAHTVSIYSDKKFCIIGKGNRGFPDRILEGLSDHDIIIIEGMKTGDFPKIEVVRQGVSNSIICDQHTLIAVATNASITNLTDTNVRVIDLNDVKAIVAAMLSYFGA